MSSPVLHTQSPLRDAIATHSLFTLQDQCIRVPIVIRGELRIPAAITKSEIEHAFETKDAGRSVSSGRATYIRLNGVQVLRPAHAGGDDIYTVLPDFDPMDLIEPDPGALADTLYALPFDEVLDYIGNLHRSINEHADILDHIREATAPLSDVPPAWHDAAFVEIAEMLDLESLRKAVDHDLCRWGVDGTRFLDEWVSVDSRALRSPVHGFADAPKATRTPQLRAFGTRQLHITAGNSPQIPLVSALRALATKSAAVIKSPAGATVPASLFGAIGATMAPDHPITQHMSFVYWPGGNARFEDILFTPGLFDRIVVWGAPEAVADVKAKASLTKVVAFNPRYSVSFVGADFENVAHRAVTDSLVANQKACIASQVHYVQASDPEQVRAYARAVQESLAAFDEKAPNAYHRGVIGQLKRLQRGRLLDGDWFINETGGKFQSGCVIAWDAFPMGHHPMCRLIVIRPVEKLEDALQYLHPAVATIGVHPEERRLELRDRIAAHGVSNIVPLGEAGLAWPGLSHDGMMVLGELVDWKNA